MKNQPSLKLDQAISQMSKLLPNVSALPPVPLPNSSSLEDYISLLNDRYNKIVDLLANEEIALQKAQHANKILKEKLASEIQNHSATVSLAQTELARLTSQNASSLQMQCDRQLSKNYKSISLKLLKEKNSQIESDTSSYINSELTLTQDIESLTQKIGFLQREKEGLTEIEEIEGNRNKQLNERQDELKKENERLKKLLVSLKAKKAETEEKISLLVGEKGIVRSDIEKLAMEHRTQLKKDQNQASKISELSTIAEQLKSELETKTSQLSLLRSKNINLESKLSNYVNQPKQITIQKELNSHLNLENKVLLEELTDISRLLVLNEDKQKITLKTEDAIYFGVEPEEQKILKKNKDLKKIIDELEIEGEERRKVVEEQLKKIEELEGKMEKDRRGEREEGREKEEAEERYEEMRETPKKRLRTLDII